MPGLAQRIEQYSNAYSVSANGFWSKHRDDVSYNQLQKFWSELPPQARQELLRIDKQALFEQARKNMYCSRCNGLLLEGFLQIVMYGKSLQQDGAVAHLSGNAPVASKNQSDGGSTMTNGFLDDIQDPSVHPWGGLTTTRDGSLTLLDCYLYSKSLKGFQNVFDSARARERERELLYPDACGGGGRGWISQGMASFGRGHGTRETCALHTARLSCDTLVDFWSALGEETRLSLLRMKEEDFIERLMYRFDSKRFCRDCRRNVIREFKELKELKRMRRETRCTSWFCVADTAFQYEVSDDTVQADWRQNFSDTVGTYHHFEWAVGTGEGKSDILEFENVGMNGTVQGDGLDLSGLSACFITLRAWKLDGRCTELSVKAHALKGQQCVHCRLVVGDGFVTITRGESIRRFFEHAEEAEEEEDDDSMDKEGNELDGECSRPQKHAKSPELAREFLLDAATVIFKEQVEKAFREGTARQNAHSIFVCLALKLLEERVHVACKEIITLEKQMKLLEEEEKEKREEEERKERRRMKDREKKLRRKERLKGKERDKEKKLSPLDDSPILPDVSKEQSSASVHVEPSNAICCGDSMSETGDNSPILFRPGSPDIQEEHFSNGCSVSRIENYCYDSPDREVSDVKDGNDSFQMEQSKFSRRRLKFRKEVQFDSPLKWSDKRRFAVASETGSVANKCESRYHSDNFETSAKGINGLNRPLWINTSKSSTRSANVKFNEKNHCSNNRMSDRFDSHFCYCNQQNEYRAKVEPHVSATRVGREPKSVSKSETGLDMSKQFYRGNKYNQIDCIRDGSGRPKTKTVNGNNPSSRDSLYSKKVWEPMESKKYPRSNSDSDVTLRSTTFKGEGVEHYSVKSSGETCSSEVSGNLGEVNHEGDNIKKSRDSSLLTDEACQNGLHVEAKNAFCSVEASYNEAGLCHTRNSTLSSDPIMSSTSNSDNCSSCLSEGDSNTVSSNHGNLESSSTSDSEDASQQSEGRDTVCTQNGFSECHEVGMEKKQSTNGGEAMVSRPLVGLLPESMASKLRGHLSTKAAQNPDIGISNVSVGSQHQGLYPPLHNQNIQFPVFQPPSTMSYYHQNSVSWPAAPANGLIPFPHPNNYLYAGPLGYGLNGNSRLCMQYGALQHVATPLFNPGPVPVYQPVAKANGINTEEQTHISKQSATQDAFQDANTERVVSARPHPTDAPAKQGAGPNENAAKQDTGNNGFSLFHFGGPVALSTGCKLNPVPSKDEIVGNFSSQFSADHVENDHACNKKETSIEEYNLFAASNGISFSFF
ncbi:hypothetical protein Dsin_007031 [Dipteronia sinensis]|uniref:Stress response protein NST1 n=1 Tax=Dipteronia sinensis TaxID=43782 RepID=A0AAE0EGG1_9ROSI|nr:hypothetical protein Dsin_007031 [Dipteronia sinensis]